MPFGRVRHDHAAGFWRLRVGWHLRIVDLVGHHAPFFKQARTSCSTVAGAPSMVCAARTASCASTCLKPSAMSASMASLIFWSSGESACFALAASQRARRADFVAQFDDDAFRRFFADAGNLRERFHVAARHRAAKRHDVHAAQNVQRGFRADAADAVDEQPEQIPFRRRREAVKNVRVFADDELREQFHRRCRAQAVCRTMTAGSALRSRRRSRPR